MFGEIGKRPVITDAQTLCDAEITARFNSKQYWTNTLQHISLDLTKMQSRECIVEILRGGDLAMQYDQLSQLNCKRTGPVDGLCGMISGVSQLFERKMDFYI